MIRNLKVIGLAIIAVLAMSAVWAVAAQAAVPSIECTSTTNTCTITGTEINTHTFNVQGGNTRCRASLHATMNNKKATAISGIRTTLTGCRVFGVNGNVNMGTCTYTLNMAEAIFSHTANTDLVCGGGGRITIEAPTLPCTITVSAQTGKSHVVFTNEGVEPTHVRANVTVSGWFYNMAGAGCPATGSFTDGTLNAETTLEGFNDLGPNSNTDGNKVGLHIVT